MIDTSANRIRLRAPLRPALGSRFQPTGFPDLGAAEFTSYNDDGAPVRSLLVESTQSMANRLENTTWDPTQQAPIALLSDLPHVEVRHADGPPHRFLTSSRQEAHRLASPFVREAQLEDRSMAQVIGQRLDLANHKPLDYPAMARSLMSLDPLVLLHGCFFNQKAWPGQPRFARAVSGAIEAHDIEQAISGGRKSDHVRHTTSGEGDEGTALGGSSEGYGSIPFSRVEYTARRIEAQFSVDVQLLRSYGLTPHTTELLTTLALWEIRTFLETGLRLRTACDLDLAGDIQGTALLPTTQQLTHRLQELLPQTIAELDHTGPLTVLWSDDKPKKPRKPTGKKTVPAPATTENAEAQEEAASA
ncbi:type I-G CRISPR-associated RAMP protein Csb1/Cas7g [Streptomyces profundus]|uniref:type I-G CRISPR-associated RAMP protein Csb1/Cas7g n=1 Tax=Streptomyces profundus TaxID=2867410 RepID=UPI001D168C9D|nr:type I-U CRISPR-associated RAMP protein Csb1/Cas7u [Streptomyces sp. MA3_2.13]UED86309.1 type I-U CRISPR-associated protein Cas7 [Streptomyces sp. MA3_2.13]